MKIKTLLNKFSSRGFTLIELIVVIAIIGILAVFVITAINPVKKINQAKDSNIKADIVQIANAMQTYYAAKGTTGTAYYPMAVADLVTAGELKSEPKINGTTSYSMSGATSTGTACTTALANCAEVIVYTLMNEFPTSYYCWASATGAVKISLAGATAPTATSTVCP